MNRLAAPSPFRSRNPRRPVGPIIKTTVWAALLCTVACAPDPHAARLIDQIPDEASDRLLGPNDYSEQQASLEKSLARLWKDEYRIVSKRVFVQGGSPQWVSLDKGIGGYVRTTLRGSLEYHRAAPAGLSGVSVWKVGLLRPQRVAVAMAYGSLPDGGTLYGYYQVEKH